MQTLQLPVKSKPLNLTATEQVSVVNEVRENQETQDRKLSTARLIRLVDWIRANLKTLQEIRPSMTVAGEMASKDLGFVVTKSNFRGGMKALEIPLWKKLPREKNGAVRIDRSAVLARFVCKLAESLGVPVPDNVNQIARGHGQNS